MRHVSPLKVICATLLVGAMTGCSPSGAPSSNPGPRRLGSYGVTASIPAGWRQVPLKNLPGAIVPLQVASFSADGAVRSICDPHPIVAQIPPGGALLQILRDGGSNARRLRLPSAVTGRPGDYGPLPRSFHLGPPQSHECGETYDVVFRKRGQVLQLRVWTAPGGMSKDVRQQIDTLIDSLRVSSY